MNEGQAYLDTLLVHRKIAGLPTFTDKGVTVGIILRENRFTGRVELLFFDHWTPVGKP